LLSWPWWSLASGCAAGAARPPPEETFMSRRLAALAAVTLLVVLAAIWAVIARQQATQSDLGGSLMFPALKAAQQDIARIEIGAGTEKITINRAGTGWSVAERAGYPANANRVQTLVIALADLVMMEPRTSRAERYAEIGVDDPGPNAKSVSVSVSDASGKALASLIIGKSQTMLAGATGLNTYVRKPGEAQSWLGKGGFTLDHDPAQWLDKDLLVLVRERVMAAMVVSADGSTLSIARAKPTDETFQIANIPAGREARTPTIAAPLANALGFLAAEDVRRADTLDFNKAPVTSIWRTFDGLVLTVTTIEHEGKVWARLDAAVDMAQVEAAKALEKILAPDGTNLIKDAAAVATEAETLGTAWNGWAFALEGTKAKDLRTQMDDLLAPVAGSAPAGMPGMPMPMPMPMPGGAAPGGPASMMPRP